MRKIIERTIYIIIAILICITIFGFSNQNATKSSSVSRKVAETIIETDSKNKKLSTKEKENLISAYQPFIRKGAHFSIYFTLGIDLILLMSTFEIDNKKRIVIAALIGLIYAISDEIHQLFIEGRSGEFRDVCIDFCGILIGIGIVYGIKWIIKKIKTKQEQNTYNIK